jgi:hypothetical protein
VFCWQHTTPYTLRDKKAFRIHFPQQPGIYPYNLKNGLLIAMTGMAINADFANVN